MSQQQSQNQFQNSGAQINNPQGQNRAGGSNQQGFLDPSSPMNAAQNIQQLPPPLDEETQDKLNTIRMNEVKFETWYTFMAQEQVGRMRNYMDTTLGDFNKKQQDFQKNQKMLEDVLREFDTLGASSREQSDYFHNETVQKKRQLDRLESERGQRQDTVNSLEQQIQEVKLAVNKIGTGYRVADQYAKIEKPEKLEDPQLIKLFSALYYILHDCQPFDWNDFQKRSFTTKGEIDQKQLEKWLTKQDKPQAQTQQKAPPIQEVKQPTPQQEPVQDSSKPTQKATETAAEPTPDKIQIQLCGVNFGALPQAKIDYMKEFSENQDVLESQAYTNNVFMYQSIIEWMKLILQGNDLERQKEEADNKLMKVKHEIRRNEKKNKHNDDSQLESLWDEQASVNDQMVSRTRQVIEQIVRVQQVLENGKQFVLCHASQFNELLQSIDNEIQIDEKLLKK